MTDGAKQAFLSAIVEVEAEQEKYSIASPISLDRRQLLLGANGEVQTPLDAPSGE